jgi:hypothetical protein
MRDPTYSPARPERAEVDRAEADRIDALMRDARGLFAGIPDDADNETRIRRLMRAGSLCWLDARDALFELEIETTRAARLSIAYSPRCRRLTPGCPPFVNSMPLASSADRRASVVRAHWGGENRLQLKIPESLALN